MFVKMPRPINRLGGRACRAAAVGVWSSAILLLPGSATAGPPFRTDDPVPVDLGHYEFYTFSTGTHVSNDISGVLPGFEFNYGLIPDGQFHVVAPVAFDSPSGDSTRLGYGDTELGFKYRFIHEDRKGWMPQVATFPLLEIPTGDGGRGLGAGHVSAFFPIWVQKSFGKWTTYGGGGYWINHGNGDRDFWFVGWLLQRQVTDKLTLGGEIFYQTADAVDGKDSTAFNVGGFYDITAHNHILFSAGTGLQNASETDQFSWYLGYQFTY
jgi:hypothetical protein